MIMDEPVEERYLVRCGAFEAEMTLAQLRACEAYMTAQGLDVSVTPLTEKARAAHG
jgi:hypothetical protein